MINRILTVSVIVISLAASAGFGQAVISSEIKSLDSSPTAEQLQQIDQYVQSIVQTLTDETMTAVDVINQRAGIIEQINHGSSSFNAALAKSISTNFSDTVFAANAKPIVKVNAAMIAAAIESADAANLFAEMVQNENPAVRYYGWKGFANISEQLSFGDGRNLNTFLNAVKTLGVKESNLMVASSMSRACNIKISDQVTHKNAEAIRNTMLETIESILTSNLQAIRDGNVAACDLAVDAMMAAATVFTGSTAEQKRPILQIVSNVIANATAAYKDGGKLSADKIIVPHSSIAIAITEGERAINDIAELNSLAITRQVAQLIKKPSAADLGELQSRVDELIGGNGSAGTLARLNINPPRVLSPTK